MLLNGGRLGDTRILSRKTVELMTQNHIAHLADPHPNKKNEQGFGLGVRVITDLGESPTPGTVGAFGWDGAATTNVQIDPKERTVAILLFQHGTFNEDDIIDTFTTGYYSALEN
jgi:CubicO group peptidase (beta-lactamase class C family)